ncbi:AP-1 complex subunit mu-1-like, partial [Clarias magur]
ATFDCSRRNLTSIPQQIWPNVTELDLSGNQLNLLHTKILKKLKHFQHLVKLNLSANYLPLLVQQHFYHLPSLEILDLSGCKLAAVKPGALLNFPRLQKLFLDNDGLQTPVPAVLRLHGWVEVVDGTSNLPGSDRPKEVVQVGWRRERHSDFDMDTDNGIFLRKLLAEVPENIDTRNTTGNNEKRSPDAWKYLVAALVTAISLSVLITIGAKCKLIHRYLSSYRHSRLSEGDGASQCDPANFDVGFSSHGNIPNSNMVLICRNYMGSVNMSEIDHLMPIMMKREEEAELSPLVSHGSTHFLYIKHNNIYLVAVTKKNTNAALVYSFLYKLVEVFTEYFKVVEEESIRDNFVTVYELLDEIMDFGFPQTTDSKILLEYITQQGHKLEVGAPRPPATVTNAVSWRSEGIRYRKNEVFMDVIESVNLLVSATGSVLRSEILGCIKLKVVLSGMPELRLGLNDKVLFEITGREKSKSVELEDVKFHQCVRLSRFENDRTISFIPPDGESELMSYRLNTTVKPLIWIESVIEKFTHSRVEIKVKARSQFKSRSTANNVVILVPVPSDADSPKFKTSTGSAKWVPEKSAVEWTIKSFPGGKEYIMRAHFGLPSVESDEQEAKRPITVKFEIPYFTVSGIQVRYLKIIEKSGYQALPWVRYITQSG